MGSISCLGFYNFLPYDPSFELLDPYIALMLVMMAHLEGQFRFITVVVFEGHSWFEETVPHVDGQNKREASPKQVGDDIHSRVAGKSIVQE